DDDDPCGCSRLYVRGGSLGGNGLRSVSSTSDRQAGDQRDGDSAETPAVWLRHHLSAVECEGYPQGCLHPAPPNIPRCPGGANPRDPAASIPLATGAGNSTGGNAFDGLIRYLVETER